MIYFRTKRLSIVSIASALMLSACGGGGGSGSSSPTTTTVVSPDPIPVGVSVSLSGTLTYDRVPFGAPGNFFSFGEGLDFDSTTQEPIRSAPVELLSANGTVLQSTVSDDNGAYSFAVESGQDVRVRVRAEIIQSAPNEIDFQVVDNTSSNAVYAIQGTLETIPAVNQTRDLNADSGWGGSSYTGARSAAPFALLDTIYGTIEDFIAVDPDINFPAFDILWSTRNRTESGNVSDGEIGSSSFTISNGVPVIRILGDEDNDTDEFDVHVVVHEFGHYFENSLSRSDSIGGSHSPNNLLDARLAFGEGWGNALSGMILDDPLYRDSFGTRQSNDFDIDVENNVYASTGWYSEGSVQSILYDLFDSVDDGADTASFGLGPIYGAFTDPAYRNTEAFTTIFAFLEALENQSGVTQSDVDALINAQLISGTGSFGVGETNNGGLPDTLPVYENQPLDGTPVGFCSFDDFGETNRHGNRQYFRLDIPTAGTYDFSMVQNSDGTSSGPSDPDFFVFREGRFVAVGGSGVGRSETQRFTLDAGVHVMEAFAFANTGTEEQIESGGLTRGDYCFDFTVEAQ